MVVVAAAPASRPGSMPNMCGVAFRLVPGTAQRSLTGRAAWLPIGMICSPTRIPSKPDQRHEGRRRGADVEKAVDHADQNTG